MAGQIHRFPAQTWGEAGRLRRQYEARCRAAGAIAVRGETEWENRSPHGVLVQTEYEFTDLHGSATVEAEEVGIIEYWSFKTVLYGSPF